jgi:hypothetical protein
MTTINGSEPEMHFETQEPQPFSRQELRGMIRAPLRMADLVLGARQRFIANVAQEHRLPTLLLALTIATVVFALPFGAVLGLARFWRVAVLLLGGLAICLPSLHIFGRYLGARMSWAQTLSVSLAATAVTSLFTLAFAPIIGFLRATMNDAGEVPWEAMAVLLLIGAFAAGIAQLFRMLRGASALRALGPSLGLVLIPWLALYCFITFRLANVLSLVASGASISCITSVG